MTQSLQLADRGLRSTLLAAPPTYLAAVILALGVLRQPNSRLVNSDVQLLASATEFVQTWYLQRDFGTAFTQTCTQLRERVVSIFQRSGGSTQKPVLESPTGNGSETIASQHLQPGITGLSDHTIALQGHAARCGSKRMEPPSSTEQNVDLFGNFEFEDLYMMDLECMIYDEGNPFTAQ